MSEMEESHYQQANVWMLTTLIQPRCRTKATHAFWGGLQGWFPEGMEVLYVGTTPEPEPEPPSKGALAALFRTGALHEFNESEASG